MGYGRSGSTILDTILGAHNEVVSVGELSNAPVSCSNPLEYCACGRVACSCPFWLSVQEEWCKISGNTGFEKLLTFQQKYERFCNLPYMLCSRLFMTRSFKEYLRMQQKLYYAIATVSGKHIVVDSSKNPIRALALSSIPSVVFLPIHLVRDGRGVVWSLLKSYKQDPKAGLQKEITPRHSWKTTCFWLLTNFLSELLFWRNRRKKIIRIRYEDLVEHTQETLGVIDSFVGLDYSSVEKKIAFGKELQVGHTVAGNRTRMLGAIKLKLDHEWEKKLPAKDRRIFWSVAWPLAIRYGYKRNKLK